MTNQAHTALTWSAFPGGASPLDYIGAALVTADGRAVRISRPRGVEFRIEIAGTVVHQSPWHEGACAVLNANKVGVS